MPNNAIKLTLDWGERVFDNQNGFEFESAPKVQLPALLGFIGLALLAGIASGSVVSINVRGWYASMSRPPFAPPNPLSTACWGFFTVLYLLMAIAAWQVWRRDTAFVSQRPAMNAWGWQLAIGAAWPAVFFGFHAMFAASIILAALFLSVTLAIWRFTRLDTTAAILLSPYLIWVGFASYLSAGFWWLNH